MGKSRLEAFSDGVIAIIITIMVLELKASHAETLVGLRPLTSTLISYVLSFVYVGIYWNNHHHMFHAVTNVRGPVLWANLHLLFWMSLVPFVTSWVGESHFASWPVAAYGAVLLATAAAWDVLSRMLTRDQRRAVGGESILASAFGKRLKETASIVAYAIGIGVAFVQPWAALAIYTAVAAMWFIPDRRIERAMTGGGGH